MSERDRSQASDEAEGDFRGVVLDASEGVETVSEPPAEPAQPPSPPGGPAEPR
ncbi:hypothetical protein ACH35V_39900 [Actinomadura sp. 1N219]|uniref:hypothetical protein n=1 Tax=Actinomadura sp. 1N219 TaxID=3375152 RepID=UPI0037902A20